MQSGLLFPLILLIFGIGHAVYIFVSIKRGVIVTKLGRHERATNAKSFARAVTFLSILALALFVVSGAMLIDHFNS
jgi:hypothetical protein